MPPPPRLLQGRATTGAAQNEAVAPFPAEEGMLF